MLPIASTAFNKTWCIAGAYPSFSPYPQFAYPTLSADAYQPARQRSSSCSSDSSSTSESSDDGTVSAPGEGAQPAEVHAAPEVCKVEASPSPAARKRKLQLGAVDAEVKRRALEPAPERSELRLVEASATEHAPEEQGKLRLVEAKSIERGECRLMEAKGIEQGECRLVEARVTREVFLGQLPHHIGKRTVSKRFQELFEQLPEYRALYGSKPCILRMHKPAGQYSKDCMFVEFADSRLARTAVQMSGLRICGQSVSVAWTAQRSSVPEALSTALDVTGLRDAGLISWAGGEGMTMLCEVYIGSTGSGLPRCTEALVAELNAAMQRIPEVRERFPSVSPVVHVQICEEGKFAFVQLANEVLASTLVCLGKLDLSNGMTVRTGWPVNAKNAETRAAPSLVDTPVVSGEVSHDRGGDCEVYVANTFGASGDEVARELEVALRSLPSFKATYSETVCPVVGVQIGNHTFAFARMIDPTLASTVIAMGRLRIRGCWSPIGRPSAFIKTGHLGAPPLPGAEILVPMLTLPVPPPPCPPPPKPEPSKRIWIGNIPRAGANVGDLEDHLTRLALETPGFDLEEGPPTTSISIYARKEFAFVDLRDSALVELLVPVYHKSIYFDSQLNVQVAAARRWMRELHAAGA